MVRCLVAKNRSANKDSRLSIRIDPVRRAVIARAAKCQGDTLSDFLLDSAYQMASELLADVRPISLSRKQLAQIFATLDYPPAKNIAGLRKLFSERSVLDG